MESHFNLAPIIDGSDKPPIKRRRISKKIADDLKPVRRVRVSLASEPAIRFNRTVSAGSITSPQKIKPETEPKLIRVTPAPEPEENSPVKKKHGGGNFLPDFVAEELFEMLFNGASIRECTRALGIASGTVQSHRKLIIELCDGSDPDLVLPVCACGGEWAAAD